MFKIKIAFRVLSHNASSDLQSPTRNNNKRLMILYRHLSRNMAIELLPSDVFVEMFRFGSEDYDECCVLMHHCQT